MSGLERAFRRATVASAAEEAVFQIRDEALNLIFAAITGFFISLVSVACV